MSIWCISPRNAASIFFTNILSLPLEGSGRLAPSNTLPRPRMELDGFVGDIVCENHGVVELPLLLCARTDALTLPQLLQHLLLQAHLALCKVDRPTLRSAKFIIYSVSTPRDRVGRSVRCEDWPTAQKLQNLAPWSPSLSRGADPILQELLPDGRSRRSEPRHRLHPHRQFGPM